MKIPAVVFQSWLVTNPLPLFSLQLKTCCFYLAYTCKDALRSKVWWKYYHWGREKQKAAEKDPSTTIVAIVCSTGATAAGRVNATEFWQRQTQPPSVLLLLSYKMDLAIPQWSTLHPGSQMIYNNYRFCNNYFCTQFASLRDVLYSIGTTSNETEAVPIKKIKSWKKQSKEVTVAKTVITTAYLATWWKQKSLEQSESEIQAGHFTPELLNTFEVFLWDRLAGPDNRTWPMQSESVLLERESFSTWKQIMLVLVEILKLNFCFRLLYKKKIGGWVVRSLQVAV